MLVKITHRHLLDLLLKRPSEIMHCLLNGICQKERRSKKQKSPCKITASKHCQHTEHLIKMDMCSADALQDVRRVICKLCCRHTFDGRIHCIECCGQNRGEHRHQKFSLVWADKMTHSVDTCPPAYLLSIHTPVPPHSAEKPQFRDIRRMFSATLYVSPFLQPSLHPAQ